MEAGSPFQGRPLRVGSARIRSGMHLDDPAAFASTGRTVARFDAHPTPFRLELQGCPTPGCWCRDATVVAVELAADPTAALSLRLTVDLDTGAPTGPAEGPAAVRDELVRDLPLAARDGARARLRALRARELDRFALDRAWLGSPGLWPFSHLLRGGVPDEPSYRGLYDRFTDPGGRRWAIQDLYCPLPGCDCREVTLSFDGEDGAVFTARLGFVPGSVAIADVRGLSPAEARAAFEAWSATERFDRARFASRYRTLREHLAGVAAARPAERPAPVPKPRPPAPIGPNQPCPCGSGKKYKRCHGVPPGAGPLG